MCTHCTEPILLLMAIAQATLTYSEYACNSILVQGVRENLKDIDPSTHALAAAH